MVLNICQKNGGNIVSVMSDADFVVLDDRMFVKEKASFPFH